MGTYSDYSPGSFGKYTINEAQLREVTPPAVEPVSRETAKNHLRVDFTDDDDLIDAYVQAARELMEKDMCRAMVQRTSTAYIPSFAEVIHIPKRPITSIQKIEYWSTDSPSTLVTLYDSTSSPQVTSDRFEFNREQGTIIRASGKSWPHTATRHDAVRITFIHGSPPDESASPIDHRANIPQPLKHAVLMVLGDLYENREEQSPLTMMQLPTVKRICNLYRYRR